MQPRSEILLADTLFRKVVKSKLTLTNGEVHDLYLHGRSGNDLLVSKEADRRNDLQRINYSQIESIRMKRLAPLQTLLIAIVIGLAPIVAGQGGAYVAILSFPLSIIISVILAVSKRTYKLHGRLDKFEKITSKLK